MNEWMMNKKITFEDIHHHGRGKHHHHEIGDQASGTESFTVQPQHSSRRCRHVSRERIFGGQSCFYPPAGMISE